MNWEALRRFGWSKLVGCKGRPTCNGLTPQARQSMTISSRSFSAPPQSHVRDDEDLSVYLRRLQTLTSHWAGEPLGEGGLLRVLNSSGTRPPLLWCYNSEHEFDRMGAGLGPDQPLVGMRSLNRIAPTGPERQLLVQRLADRYVDILVEAMDVDRCAVGGNCQSSAIATHMALRLLRQGKQVDLLLNLEATPPVPYPGRVALLFGRESETHNPFFRTERPQDLWRSIHREVSWTVVPGAHGQYFTDANVSALCAAIRAHLSAASEAPPLKPEPEARLVLRTCADRAPTGSALILQLQAWAAGKAAGLPFFVLPLWWSETLGAWPSSEEAMAPLPIETGPPVDLVLPTPNDPGPWQLRLVLCQKGEGPIGWKQEADPVLMVRLEEEEVLSA